MKLKLDVDTLEVQSFVTSATLRKPGTVRAHDSIVTYDQYYSCALYDTCGNQTCGQDTCNGTCGNTQGLCPGNSVELSACCATVGCTQDPRNFQCYFNSVDVCPDTVEANCCDTSL